MALPKVSLALVVACSLAAAVPHIASAQRITIDGHLPGVQAQTLIGPYYSIGANLGKQEGGNLFHSFGQFGLVKGETAAFTSTGSTTTINNVIGRVTGGSRSDIDGKIKSDIAGANLFLINPSGIVFGPNATVNVSGSFHASTADYLKMSDGAKFQATNPDGSTLRAAPPAAFGFLTASPAAISVNGTTLGPVPGTLGLVGGPVSISGATLSAPAGTIHVTSAAGTGEVPVDPRNSGSLTVNNFGPVDIKGGSTSSILTASNPSRIGGGGSVFVRSDALTIDDSVIAANNSGSGPGGQLVLRGDTRVALSNNALVQAVTRGSGSGAGVLISTASNGAISADASTVEARSLGSGAGGSITIVAGQLALHNGANVLARTSGTGSGGALDVRVSGPLTVDSGASLGTWAEKSSDANAGDVSVTASGRVTIDMTAGFETSILGGIGSLTQGTGGTGKVTVGAGSLNLTNNGAILNITAAAGKSGDVFVNVSGPVNVDSGAFVGTGTTGNGYAGNVSVLAAGLVTIDRSVGVDNSLVHGIGSFTSGTGNSGDVSVSAGALSIGNFGIIWSPTTGRGSAGNVTVTADKLAITNGGRISASTFGRGDAGNVTVNVAGGLTIDGTMTPTFFTGIASQANPTATGNAGNITVNAGGLAIISSGGISSPTFGPGSGGDVAVNVSGELRIDGTMAKICDACFNTGITTLADRNSTGKAGDVTVTAETVKILANGRISGETLGAGDGGNVTLRVTDTLVIDGTGKSLFTGVTASADPDSTGKAGNLTIDTGGAVTLSAGARVGSATFGRGDGGAVQVTAQGALTLRDPDTKIAASAQPEASGNAGSVTVSAPQIIITTGAQIASTTAGTGAGGSVDVTTGALVLDGAGVANTRIAASATGAQSGPGGPVTVTADTLTVEGGAQIASTTAGPGNGGDVNVSVASDIVLPDHGPQITAQSTGSGNAGSITVSAVRLLMNNGAAISTAAETADGGNLMLKVSDLVYLLSSKITTSVNRETGNGGNITIDPQLVVLNHSSITATAAEGHGGNIRISAGAFIQSADSSVDASSEKGISGTVLITGPRVDVNGALVVLSSELRGHAAVLREACATRGDRPISSLVEAGRGGLPQDPEATLPALYIADRDLNPNPQAGADKTEASSIPLRTTVRLTMPCG